MAEISKEHVAQVLEHIATMLELKGENVFKIRAYQNAARAMETFGGNLQKAVGEATLATVPGIGKAIAEKITELVVTGNLSYYNILKAEFPPGIFDMFGIPGMGPKKIQAVWQKLGIVAIADLEAVSAVDRLDVEDVASRHPENALHGSRDVFVHAVRELDDDHRALSRRAQ